MKGIREDETKKTKEKRKREKIAPPMRQNFLLKKKKISNKPIINLQP